MKMISKIATASLGLVLVGSSVFAQSLADAKKAIDAEQYQKAKSMLKNLTATQADKDENFFYLGWVYIKQDYTDSAKTAFNKGIAVNAKSALNYAGLGAVARLDKDNAGATNNFNQATTLAGKNSKPYVYVGQAYLLPITADGKVSPADANAAISVLTKGKAVNPKDADLLIALGNAYRSQLKSNEAYQNYSDATAADPKNPGAKVATGVLWRFANNFEDSEKQFQDALAIDPNYGPAYREWAETDLRWSMNDPKMASVKIKAALDEYKKYLSLTDLSIESRMRYCDFLILAGDYKTLQQEATALSQSAGNNARVYRYLAYSAYENKDYPAGLTAMNTWFQKADPKRIIPRDYLYMGRLQVKSGQDSAGINTLRKALTLDTTQADVYGEIASSLYAQKKYAEAGDAYKVYISKSHTATLNDYLKEGVSYYNAFKLQYYSTANPKPVADTTLLVKADSAFSYIQHKASAPLAAVALYQARANDLKEPSRNTTNGYAKPYYEQYITLLIAKQPVADADKPYLAEAYVYLATYYEFKEKDDAKAAENYTKAREADPTNKQVLAYFARKGGAGKSK
ncbi:tetratricopeptide repeat protein [Mucilaginibacter lappiensis]|jgi:Tfp pilus assembly protein PilF|uniref:tetratricopeptide repeat protein n=1 Tax=Mucilaginibacter lappiensis TaxID=354630 RepID=UPI003D1E9267